MLTKFHILVRFAWNIYSLTCQCILWLWHRCITGWTPQRQPINKRKKKNARTAKLGQMRLSRVRSTSYKIHSLIAMDPTMQANFPCKIWWNQSRFFVSPLLSWSFFGWPKIFTLNSTLTRFFFFFLSCAIVSLIQPAIQRSTGVFLFCFFFFFLQKKTKWYLIFSFLKNWWVLCRHLLGLSVDVLCCSLHFIFISFIYYLLRKDPIFHTHTHSRSSHTSTLFHQLRHNVRTYNWWIQIDFK